jgi:uncharacterized protein YbjQ (UPF0145 family)
VGGELTKYNEMMNNARALATKRMVEQAAAMGADAIVCIRYTSSSIMQSAAEVTAYGTAVRIIGDWGQNIPPQQAPQQFESAGSMWS